MNALRVLEQQILREGQEYTRGLLESRLQEQIDQMGAICPHNGLALKEVSYRPLVLLTVAGKVRLKAAYGYWTRQATWLTPARVIWAMAPYQQTSPELQARVVETASACGSYEKAARTATLWGTPISDDLVHAQVQEVGQRLVDHPATEPPAQVGQRGVFDGHHDGWVDGEGTRQGLGQEAPPPPAMPGGVA